MKERRKEGRKEWVKEGRKERMSEGIVEPTASLTCSTVLPNDLMVNRIKTVVPHVRQSYINELSNATIDSTLMLQSILHKEFLTPNYTPS